MNFLSLLEAKRDGQAFSVDAITALVHAYTAGKIPDYQMAALLMAIFFRGLNDNETRELTLAMRDSGDALKFPADSRPLVDKHSTGGVGDKVSLPLAPLLACLDFRVPMISGRGLGITGGTLDKLESIPGFTTALSVERIVTQVQSVGCVICGPTDRMVPADKALYALRDVTATVPSIPLITASILSKKLAESLDALLLDVKFGCAAFMQTRAQARALAAAIVGLAEKCGLRVRALLTDMNQPLGKAVGNWLEVKESVACLEGKGPDDLRELVIDCAAHLLAQTNRVRDVTEGRDRASACLASGAPRQKWDEMIKAQGAELDAFTQKVSLNHTAPVIRELTATREGFVSRCDARIVGEVVRDLGGGRLTKETVIDPNVGLDTLAKVGERTTRDSVLCRVHAADPEQATQALVRLEVAFVLSDETPSASPLILEVVSKSSSE